MIRAGRERKGGRIPLAHQCSFAGIDRAGHHIARPPTLFYSVYQENKMRQEAVLRFDSLQVFILCVCLCCLYRSHILSLHM